MLDWGGRGRGRGRRGRGRSFIFSRVKGEKNFSGAKSGFY